MGTVCDKYWHLFDSLTKCTTKLINGRQSWLLSNMNAVCVYCVDNPQRPMLYNGVFGCHGNMCYVIFIGAILYMIHIIGPSNACTNVEINQYEIDEVRKYAKIVFYLTSRDAKTVGRTSLEHDQEHRETNPKSLRLPVQTLWLK